MIAPSPVVYTGFSQYAVSFKLLMMSVYSAYIEDFWGQFGIFGNLFLDRQALVMHYNWILALRKCVIYLEIDASHFYCVL